jgi:hypothetical protein
MVLVVASSAKRNGKINFSRVNTFSNELYIFSTSLAFFYCRYKTVVVKLIALLTYASWREKLNFLVFH